MKDRPASQMTNSFFDIKVYSMDENQKAEKKK